MYLPPATIGPNEVFDDLDGDGVQEDGEPPLANVTINLYCKGPIEGEFVLVETIVTDEAGQYQFDDVQPGLCYVEVDPDDEYVFSPVVDGGNQVHSNGTTPVIEVDYNDNVDDWSVGLYSPVTVGNKVWDDLNGKIFVLTHQFRILNSHCHRLVR